MDMIGGAPPAAVAVDPKKKAGKAGPGGAADAGEGQEKELTE
jgi:hypothetical protein